MTKYAVLIGQIQQEITELDRLVENNERLFAKLKATHDDDDYLGSIALNLHGFYSGVERIFKQIAQMIEGAVPDQGDWHRQLLRQMTVTIPQFRAPVICQATKIALDEYCSFRHAVKNIYSLNFKSERLEQLTTNLPNCFAALRQDLLNFMALYPGANLGEKRSR